MLASGADDLRIWDGDKYDMVTKHYSPPVQKISSLAWNSTNTHVACIAPGGCTIDVTAVESDDDPLGYPIIDEAVCLCWHSSSKHLGVGCTDGAVKVYDLKTQTSKKNYSGHKAPVTSITYNYNDTSLASASKAGEIILHNTITDLTTRFMTALKLQAIQAIQFSFHHHSMLASVSDDASLVLWDAHARRSVHQFARSHKAPATGLAFSPSNDKLLLSCGLDKNVVLYDVLSKNVVRSLQVDAPLSSIAMHSNGYQVASGTIRGHILLHDLRHGSKVQHSFIAHRTSVQCLAFHNRILPKKSRSSQSSHESHNGDVAPTCHTPLSAVDQNVISESPASTKQGDAMDSKSSTPHINRLLGNDSVSSTSIFSPDIGDGRRPSADSQMSADNLVSRDSINKPSGDSLFSPDVPPTRAAVKVSTTPYSNGIGKPRVPEATPAATVSPFMAVHKRELPTPPTSSRVDHRDERRSTLADKPTTSSPKTTAVHFANTKAQSSSSDTSSGATSLAGSGDADDPLTMRIREDLKQQLKSELLDEIKVMMDSMKEELKQTVLDHHFEMLKQFHFMQVHVEAQASHHSLNHQLVRQNEELKAEIERLKHTY